jgi:myo-inositol-1(or 4)-monophosphatase
MELSQEQLEKLTNEVIPLAKEVGDYALSAQKEAEITVQKDIGDFATNVDLECEKRIMKGLSELSMQFEVFSEEDATRPDTDIYWVVDPLDGTKNYYRGFPIWAINIALYDAINGEVLIGVINFPSFGDLFSAYKGGKAFSNGQEISPSKTSDYNKAFLQIEIPKSDNFDKFGVGFEQLVHKAYRIRAWGLAATICYVASGAFDAYIDFSGTTKPYDIFAAILIAKQAGCKVSNFDPTKKSQENLMITNGILKF